MIKATTLSTSLRALAGVTLVAGLAACSGASRTQPAGINDPHEPSNRKVHALNQKISASGKPNRVAAAVPTEFQSVIHNVSENLSMPQAAVNSALQADFAGFGLATYRFLVNSTLGMGGLFDVASDFKVPEHDTDFGETLYVWGVGEGPYYELPVLGPSTRRDTAGRVVDLFTNPLSYTLDSPEKYVGTVTGYADSVFEKNRRIVNGEQVPMSAAGDSYAQARQEYLQQRRADLARPTSIAATTGPRSTN
tara:strand:- start:85 stop:834 length:750 start_codon:yes stop_codon:yes gene_type:complete